MDRTRVWPDFRPEHVLFEDEDLLFVHKPAFVSSQAARADRPDDVVTRLKAWLAATKPGEPYLGVHHRLDRDTSGVMLFTRREGMNAEVARQFEGRGITKRYLAAVSGWPERARSGTLDDRLIPADDGTMRVAPRGKGPGMQGGVHAVTHYRVRERRGERALLELTLETGRTHQARVQLAHAGAPIAGDTLYGGPRAPRLMLHASSLELVHPRTRKKLVVTDPEDRELTRWLAHGDAGARIYDDVALLDRALANAVERRWGLGRSVDRDPESRRTSAFRLVNEEGDALPGLAVDVYGDHLVAQFHLSAVWDDLARRERVLDRLAALGFDGVYVKLRPKQANVLVDTRRDDVAPREPSRGTAAPEEVVVHEEGIGYLVRLGDGLSTGIFLDQRDNRRRVRALAHGAKVANLFGYTCAFSVAAALGGAARTVSVDASVVALERGRKNFELAGLDPKAHGFAAEDAFSWLARAAKKGETFDLVILDPPSYASTKKRRFVAETDYDDLVALALAVLAPGGRILACSNHRGIARAKLRKMVRKGAEAAGRALVQLKDLPDAADFPAPGPPVADAPPERKGRVHASRGATGRPVLEPHMKSVLATFDVRPGDLAEPS